MIDQEQIYYMSKCFVCGEMEKFVTCTDGVYAICTKCGSRHKIDDEELKRASI